MSHMPNEINKSRLWIACIGRGCPVSTRSVAVMYGCWRSNEKLMSPTERQLQHKVTRTAHPIEKAGTYLRIYFLIHRDDSGLSSRIIMVNHQDSLPSFFVDGFPLSSPSCTSPYDTGFRKRKRQNTMPQQHKTD